MGPVQNFHGKNHTQRGTALVMTLVFLVLLTMLGITSINTATLEERMAGNAKDQNLSFQAAETALRAAENWVESTTAATQLNVNAANGIHPASTTTEIWDSIDWTSTTNLVVYPGTPGGASTSGTLGDVATKPKYIIENIYSEAVLPTGTRITVRITARGTGASDSTISMVQSTYSKVYP